jgi:flavoprotein
MTKEDLISEAFGALNSFKRHRALKEIKPLTSDRQYHELQMFKMFDKLELSLRAIQKEIRGMKEEEESESEEESE